MIVVVLGTIVSIVVIFVDLEGFTEVKLNNYTVVLVYNMYNSGQL
jgi:hypothetical protein